MNEIKRILGNRRILLGLILIFLINGFLFAKEQVENEYGMNLNLPQTELSVSLDDGYVGQGKKQTPNTLMPIIVNGSKR